MKKKLLLIMDMDGVIADVSGSYREVVRLTVYHYLKNVMGVDDISPDAVTPEDVSALKRSGGLNNDWELTYVILNTILRSYFDEKSAGAFESFVKGGEPKDDRHLLHRVKLMLESCERPSLARVSEDSLADVYSSQQASITEISSLLLNSGDVGSGNLVKRIFQELYLGTSLFRNTYGEEPLFYKGRGYIERESCIPAKEQLQKLNTLCTLAIATGRPRSEAHYTLVSFGVLNLFRAVVTEDDVVEAEARRKRPLRKPHPYVIESCIEKSGEKKYSDIFYIGDMPDDMTAAKRAKVVPIGFVYDGFDTEREEHRDLLLQKGAERVFSNYEDLIRYIKKFVDKM
jgi:HAD superfamily hydrolase (TIGR01548 family)